MRKRIDFFVVEENTKSDLKWREWVDKKVKHPFVSMKQISFKFDSWNARFVNADCWF